MNILVHCSAGLSRSASMIVAWLMIEQKLSLKEAIEFIVEKRGRLI